MSPLSKRGRVRVPHTAARDSRILQPTRLPLQTQPRSRHDRDLSADAHDAQVISPA
jgi:hypothetical protein